MNTNMIISIVYMVALFAIFYFLFIRPQRKKEKQWKKRKKEINPKIKEKIMHEISDLTSLIKKDNKEIVNCYEIENRTILLKNQLELEKSKEIVKDKKKDKSRGR